MASDLTNIALRYVQRRVLLLSIIPLGLLFALTVTLARTYHVREAGLVQEWFQAGDQDMSIGQPGIAIEDYRNALAYDPENNLIQLRLAQALLAGGRLTEARSYFLNALDRSPGSGEVNLALAHISTQTGELDQAARYFRAAIYGSWDHDEVQQRTKVRLELCEFLLARGQTKDAQTELAALAADIPPENGTQHELTGRLFLRAGQPAKALTEFEGAVQSNPTQSQWLEDAGHAAYTVGDYPRAERYFERAVHENPANENLELLQTLREILRDDPLRAGLSDQEQALRTWRDYQQGLERLQKCTETVAASPSSERTPSDLRPVIQDAQGMKERVNLRSLAANLELRKGAIQLVFKIEETASQFCGAPTGTDQALILIGKEHLGGNP